MHEVAGVLPGDGGAVRSPLRVVLRRGVETRVDRHGPVEAPHRLAQAQIQQILECPVEHADLVRQGNGSVPLLESHADVEVERPVGRSGDHARLGPEVPVPLVHDHEVALRLASDEIERLAGQRRGVSEGLVDPVPSIGALRERKMRGIIARQRFHDELQAIPLRAHHVRQRLVAQRLGVEDHRPLAAFGDIVFVHVEGEFHHRALRSRHVRLDVDRIHVLVLHEGQREPPDGLGGVAEREVVPECFVWLEYGAHGRSSRFKAATGRAPGSCSVPATRTA